MKSTIYDVAKKSNTSIATVSRVLNNFPGISTAKREAVIDAIEQLGYVPSELARNLANNKTNLIAVYMPSDPVSFFESKYYTEIYRGMDSVLSATDYSLVILNDKMHKNQLSKEPKYYQLIKKNQIDGLIFAAIPEESHFEKVLKMDFPTVYIGEKLDEKSFHIYAGYNEYMQEILSVALSKGHKKILFFTYSFHIERMQSIAREFIKENRLPIDFIQIKDIECNWNTYLIDSILNEQVTLLVVEELRLVSLFLSFLYSRGISVPEQVSILSVEHLINDGCLFVPQISCVHVPAFNMGVSSCQMLLDRLENKQQCHTINFKSKLYVRNSLKQLN